MSKTLLPVSDRILARPLEEETVTASGILVASTARKNPTRAEVVAVGESFVNLKPGDIVVHAEYGMVQVAKDLIALKAEDIVAIEKEDIGV